MKDKMKDVIISILAATVLSMGLIIDFQRRFIKDLKKLRELDQEEIQRSYRSFNELLDKIKR